MILPLWYSPWTLCDFKRQHRHETNDFKRAHELIKEKGWKTTNGLPSLCPEKQSNFPEVPKLADSLDVEPDENPDFL